ncbi:MAG TPA: hypothetical protein VFK88_10365 [Gallionella sp.]|nr:hypothetical protein [Gallionella sp.]
MKTRLAIFAFALLALPAMGFLLSGGNWNELAGVSSPPVDDTAATVITLLALLCFALFTNLLVTLRLRSNPFAQQRSFFLALSVGSAALGWLLSYLNLYTASWATTQNDSLLLLLLQTGLFGLLAPAVLSTRAVLGLFSGWLKYLARGPALPVLPDETLIFILAPLAILGLLAGAAWPAQLFWLLWSAPLLLLSALQLLWRGSTVFAGLKSGDWGRVVNAVLSGLVVGNLAVYSFQAVGGSLTINLPNPLFGQLGFAVFGLLCLQLGDVIAEQWHGKQRSELFQQKKKFPIPVVTQKK